MEIAYSKENALRMLRSDGDDVRQLYHDADLIRKKCMGEDIYIRGIIEFSNICGNDCLYCGIRASNEEVSRYVMTEDEILAIAASITGTEQTTVVLQSGEHPGLSDKKIGDIIRRIKSETELAVTLSTGNRPYEVYRYWRDCGMDRYLLRFETSDPELFAQLHPGSTLAERIECLLFLKELGVQTGSGFMIGLPGETIEVLADNILLCRTLGLDMIGIGPFIPHPGTPLGNEKNAYNNNPEMFFKALAVLRVFNPDSHIPATTAYDAVVPGRGRDLALMRGANVFMPNITPVEYKKNYLLYPGKPSVDESASECLNAAMKRIRALGRTVGQGPGHSIRKRK